MAYQRETGYRCRTPFQASLPLPAGPAGLNPHRSGVKRGKNTTVRPTILFLLLFASLLPPSAQAAEPKVRELTAVAHDGKIGVAFELQNAFDLQELNQALESGLPTGFTYHLELFRHRPNWFDRSIHRVTIEVVATYNSRTREYLLNYRRDRKLVRSEIFTDLDKLRQRMVTISEPDLFELGEWRAHKLKVRVRADLLQGYLLYVIPWDLSTEWRETRVKSGR